MEPIMTDEMNERPGYGKEIALRGEGRDPGLPTRNDLLDAVARSVEAMRATQTMFLATVLVVLGSFVAVSVVFGLSVSSGLRAMDTRIDMDIQARASDQAAADARLDRFVESASHGTAAMAPAYALPALRRHY